jgi:hypothetical protein
MSKLCCTVLVLYTAPIVFGQDALTRLVAESVPLRVSEEMDRTKQKDALRDWIESRLPANITELDAGFSNLETRLNAEVGRAALLEASDFHFGYVSKLMLMRPVEYPGALVVRAGVSAGAVTMNPFMFIGFRRYASGCCRQRTPASGAAACLKRCFPVLMKLEVAFFMSPGMTCSVGRIGIDSTTDYFA